MARWNQFTLYARRSRYPDSYLGWTPLSSATPKLTRVFSLLCSRLSPPALPPATAPWRCPSAPRASGWFWMAAVAVRSALSSSMKIAAKRSPATTPRGWNAISAPAPSLRRGSAELSQKADPVNIIQEYTRTEKVSSPTVNISAHVLMAPWAAFHSVLKNSLSQTWAVPTHGWSK